MNPYEHAPEQPSGLPIAGAPPPGYYPDQGYGQAPPAYGYEQAHQQAAPAYGYEQAYQQAAAPPAYPQPPTYQQQPPPQMPQMTPMAPGYQQAPPVAGWGMPPEGPPAYIITAGAPGPVVKKSGAGKRVALIALVALVVAGGGAAFAADSWAKGQVCDAVQGLGDDTAKTSSSKKGKSDEPTVAELDAAEKGLNSRANLLFFHGELKEATHDLADDVDTLKTLVAKGSVVDRDARTLTQLLALAASLDIHARHAQRACGLTEKSILGTTA